MPLIDALFLDPAPFDVWIAYRTDSIKGSGTASDPWDGSPKGVSPQYLHSQSSKQPMVDRKEPSMLRTAPFTL